MAIIVTIDPDLNFQLFPDTALHAKDPLEKAQGHSHRKLVPFLIHVDHVDHVDHHFKQF